MIAYELRNFSSRMRSRFYSMFSPSGKAYLYALLVEEAEAAKQFVLTYETPELRKLEAKQKRQSLTPEEEALLQKSKKSFQGVLATGGVVTDAEATEVIKKYLDAIEDIKTEIEYLSQFKTTSVVAANTEIVFSKELSFWNLHPQAFGEQVYESLFASPDYTRRELERLFEIKRKALLKEESPKAFKGPAEIETFLVRLKMSEDDKKVLAGKLLDMKVLSDMTQDEFKKNLTSAINIFQDSDTEFKLGIYEKISKYLPQYHNKKVKWLIFALSQYNFVQNLSLTSRITLDEIYAFYRKADELCSC